MADRNIIQPVHDRLQREAEIRKKREADKAARMAKAGKPAKKKVARKSAESFDRQKPAAPSRTPEVTIKPASTETTAK